MIQYLLPFIFYMSRFIYEKHSNKKRMTSKAPKHQPQADTTRATAASGRAGARNSPDKSQGWDLKGMRSGD